MTRDELAALADRNVHVVGLASTEGAAMAAFLWANGVRRLTVHDFRSATSVATAFRRMHVGLPRPERDRLWAALAALPVQRCLGDRYLEGIEDADVVFVGQAWYLYGPNMPRLAVLRDRGVPFHSLAELYFDLSPAPILAVTGSNGKSTTSRLAEAIMRLTDRPVYYAGNERRSVQVLDRLDDMDAADLLILEISNRQLLDFAPRPHIGVITTLLPNHLDEHGGSFAAYVAVKRKLVESQVAADFAVLNGDNAACRELGQGLPGRVYWFSSVGSVGRGAWLEDGCIRLRHEPAGQSADAGPIAAALIPGEHNRTNILAAALASWLAGAPPAAIARGIETFGGLRHRIQFIWRAGGVDYFDDLNATTPQATTAALRALATPVVLIAGGDDKGLDFAELATEVVARVRRVVLLPGVGSDRLAAAVLAARGSSPGPTVDRFDSLPDAVADVVSRTPAGTTVLLSPACPSFFSQHYLGGGESELGFRAILRRLTTDGDSNEQTEEQDA